MASLRAHAREVEGLGLVVGLAIGAALLSQARPFAALLAWLVCVVLGRYARNHAEVLALVADAAIDRHQSEFVDMTDPPPS